MNDVTVRDLRNHSGEVLARVAQGEVLTITRDGRPVAELRPLPRQPLPAEALIQRRKVLPKVDPVELRANIAEVLHETV